jgi:hypothetical protein
VPHLNPDDTWARVACETSSIIKQAMRGAGRDPSNLEVSVRFPPYGARFEDQLESDMEQMLAAGVTQLYCPLRGPRTVDEAAPILEQMARLFEPYRKVVPM